MTFEEYRRYDATGLAQLVKNKDIDSADLLEIAIRRAESVNPMINAIVHPLYDLAREMVHSVDEMTPFPGIPFLLKDLTIELAGTLYSEGCAGLRGYKSRQTSAMVERLKEAGLVFLGKTNTPEFGLTPYTEPRAFGPTRNPWNTGYTAGGSSGGSAAAVAAGIAPFATASDGGGSIRIPASCCGLFGLKPSRGRISLGPQHYEGWQGAAMEHCVSRSVRDSAALLDATCGHLPGDPYYIPGPQVPYRQVIEKDPAPLRIGFCTEHTLGQAIDPECVKAVAGTAELLAGLGHHLEETPQPFVREDLTEVFLIMILGETAATVEGLSKKLDRAATRKDVEPTTWALALLGRTISAQQFVSAKRRWNDISRRVAAFFDHYDLLLTPVVSRPPFPVGALQPDGKDQRLISLINTFGLGKLALANIEKLAEKTFSYIPFTPLANMTGNPSMSVPLHWTRDGLPVGSMFTAPFGQEDLLFQLAAQLERASPWFDKVPEIRNL